MASQLGVSVRDWVKKDVLDSKPEKLGISEWVEELIVLGLKAKSAERQSGGHPATGKAVADGRSSFRINWQSDAITDTNVPRRIWYALLPSFSIVA